MKRQYFVCTVGTCPWTGVEVVSCQWESDVRAHKAKRRVQLTVNHETLQCNCIKFMPRAASSHCKHQSSICAAVVANALALSPPFGGCEDQSAAEAAFQKTA